MYNQPMLAEAMTMKVARAAVVTMDAYFRAGACSRRGSQHSAQFPGDGTSTVECRHDTANAALITVKANSRRAERFGAKGRR
jgi:acyl-coenzyme A synthetase/AMP-(fatty) acid ligase